MIGFMRKLIKKHRVKKSMINQLNEIKNYESGLILESVMIDGIKHKPSNVDVSEKIAIIHMKDMKK